MHAEVITIGDEFLSGSSLDTNSQWLTRRLADEGIRTRFHATVGDELDDCAAVFRRAIERADVIISTGGLGPTADDLTRQALAEATGRELVVVEEALAHIRDLFARRGREMPERNRLQALLPDGSRTIHNPHGTAPGILMDVSRPGRSASRVIALPGVPAEMVEMWHGQVAVAVKPFGRGRVIRQRQLKCFGAGESQIEAMLPDLIRRDRVPRVGISAQEATILLRISVEGADEDECLAAMEPTAQTVYDHLGTLVFGEEDDELQDVVLRLLHQRGDTLAVAEWGTAGLVGQWLGAAAAPRDPFLGGVVATSQAARRRMLNVPSDDVPGSTVAEILVVEAMAAACRHRFGADWGLAVGRFPPRDTTAVEPRVAFAALAGPAGVERKDIPVSGHPAILRAFSAKSALNLLRLALLT